MTVPTSTLDEVETKQGIKLPAAYRALAQGGFLDLFGAPVATIPRNERAKRIGERLSTGKALWLHDVEWFTPDSMRDDDRSGSGGLLGFAQNGGGDVWGVDAAGQVGFYTPDSGMRIDAPDFVTWLYQQLLHLFTWNAEAEHAERFATYARIVRPHLSPARRAVIDEVAARQPVTQKGGEISVLLPKEADELRAR
jgi:hypothetical protein